MTSDIVQNSYFSRERNNLSGKAIASKRFMDKSGSIPSFFKKSESDTSHKDNHKDNTANANNNARKNTQVNAKTNQSTIDKTALLKTAYKMLRQAERDLALKEERIQVLQEILTIDELTGLTNRRGFYRAFEGELDRTNRGENLGGLLVMIDLDYFKEINDRYGHLAGDEALRTVGEFLNCATRPMDVVARLGGDEFIILMPNTNIAKTIKRARKLGNALNDLSFEWKDDTIRIQASIGLKEYTQGNTIENIIEQADRGLYQNKEVRKNRSLQAAE
ncbi:MAG: GGDEF domain-containing protein [Alphaproteobacteria bacterium]|nr:GGDEF domain-containing protein [Alphaproteobacteria bacterium]